MKSLIVTAMLISSAAFASCPTAGQMEGNFFNQGKKLTLVISQIEVNNQKTDNLNVKFCDGSVAIGNKCDLIVPERTYTCSISGNTFNYQEVGYRETILLNPEDSNEVQRTNGIWPPRETWVRL